jgi:hypothetical protein
MSTALISANPPNAEPTPAAVTAAVMAVLREMSVASPPYLPQAIGGTKLPIATVRSQPTDDSVIAFPGALILERHAASIPQSARQVLVSPGTVVTPLAKEILKKRGIAVRPISALQRNGHGLGPIGEWAVLRLCNSAQAQSLESMLIGRGGDGWEILGPSAEHAVEWLDASPERHLAILAETACTAVWWAVRSGVRAAEVRGPLDVERIVTTFAPRCFVLEPSRLPIHESRQIFRTWRSMGVREASAQVDFALPASVQESRT